jgi:hypothetical protein
LKTDQPQQKPRSRWRRPGRWVFLILVLSALITVGLRIGEELRKANMSLQSTRLQSPGTTLAGIIINRQSFRIPRDTLLRTSQIAFALRVADLHDSLATQKVRPSQSRRRMAVLFDSHMMSIDEYRWIRSTLLSTLRGEGSAGRLSRQRDRLRVTEQLFRTRNGGIRALPDVNQPPYGAGS